MAATYVSVPTEQLDTLLLTRGFTPATVGAERVYTRSSKTNPALRIVVYSSVRQGDEKARKVGKDAIRVVLLGKTPRREFCLAKTTRINRTGTVEGVLDRVWDRIKEASTAAQTYGCACPKCGSPTYADSGRCIVRECREGK